ncbi:MAG: glycoside hydrolase family 3 protein, partial [Leadbetterella sp.]|nr:glycoside hydrolase family 3 protein [Leadbetterella sp.]
MKKTLFIFLVSVSSLSAQKVLQPVLGAKSTKIIKSGKLEFKDLNKNGKLDKYEDWRLPVEARVKDLLSKMTLEEKIGFMLISTTRMANDGGFGPSANPNAPISSGFNEEDLVQNVNMFTRKPLTEPNMSASVTTKAVTER